MPNEHTVRVNVEEVESFKRKLRAMVIMTEALGRISDENFNHPAHAANIARKALREVRAILGEESSG